MAGDDLGKVSFGVESTFDDKGIKDGAKGIEDLAKKAEAAGGSLGVMGTAGGVAAGIIGADLVKAFAEAAYKVATFASTVTETSSKSVESMDLMAQATGLSLQQFQQLEPVMRQNNVSAEQMGNMFRILSKHIQDAQDPTSRSAQAFDKLGLTMTGLETPSEVLTLIADRVSKLPNGFEKSRIETELLGRAGANLTGVLNRGAEGFRESADAALQMGNVLSTDANNALLAVNDSFDNLNTSQDNLSKHLGVLFAPAVQSWNEFKTSAVDSMTRWVDELTIATRTLAVRFEALFGFIKAQAQLSITEIGKIPEIFERWNYWATEQIEAIRKQSVVQKELGDSIGKVDEKAQAAARAQAQAWIKMGFELTKMDVAIKMADESQKSYNKSMEGQQALGRFIVKMTQEQIKFEAELTAARSTGALQAVDHYAAVESALRKIVSAGNAARLAAGGISGVGFEEKNAQLAIEAIDQEINAHQKKLEIIRQTFAEKQTHALADKKLQLQLAFDLLESETQIANAIELLELRKRSVKIESNSAIGAAVRKQEQDELQAYERMAGAQVRMAQAGGEGVQTVRDLSYNQLQASLNRELSAYGLTENQKTAILMDYEARRMEIARQFPTFYEQQLQSMVNANTFSMGQIATGFYNATAQMIVTGQQLSQFWTQLQISLVSAFLNTLTTFLAQQLLNFALMNKANVLYESAKTAIFGGGETARLAIAKSTNALFAAMMMGTLAAMSAIATAAFAMALAVSQVVAGIAYGAAAVMAATPFGQPAAGALIAAATGFEIATTASLVIGAGVVQGALGAAITTAAISGLSFSSGGIGDFGGGTMAALHGQEAIIPLNSQGASFMSDMLGLGGGSGGGEQTIYVMLDGHTLAEVVGDKMLDRIYIQAGVS